MGDPNNQGFFRIPVPGAEPEVNLLTSAEGQVLNGGTNSQQGRETFRGDSSPMPGADWRATARTRWGAPVPVDRIDDKTVVKINDKWDTVASWKIIGAIPADHRQQQSQPAAGRDHQKQTQQQGDDNTSTSEADRAPVVEETERAHNALMAELGETATAGIVAAFAEGREEHVLERIVGDRGAERGEVLAQVHAVADQYVQQAQKIVGVDAEDWEEFAEWSAQHAAGDRADAITAFYYKQNAGPLKALHTRFTRERGASLSDGDLIALAKQGGVPLSRAHNGRLIVRLPSGEMPLRDAIKAGLVVVVD